MVTQIRRGLACLIIFCLIVLHVSPVTARGGDIVDLQAGSTGTCIVKSDGTVWCLGGNDYGQLGDGTTIDRNSFVKVMGLPPTAKVSVGEGHVCAIDVKARVWCWGRNHQGQLGRGNLIPATKPALVALQGKAVSVATGFDHSCAVLSGGKVACWGGNAYGQLGDGTKVKRKQPAIVRTNGKARRIDVGRWYSCATFASGIAKCWGRNFGGQLGNQPRLADGYTGPNELLPVRVTDIGNASSVHTGDGTCVLHRDGVVRCWGYYWDEMAAELLEPVYVLWPTRVDGLNAVLTLSGGGEVNSATCALEFGGSVKCWGDDASPTVTPGVGEENWGVRIEPADIELPAAAALLSNGGDHACAYLVSNQLWCWGSNWYGQLGMMADQSLSQYEPRAITIP